ncbi:TMEM175 family protein [Actinomycetospora atypica]|uniref:TMEM175 family protein n=1 Tax=Actinomycetospora atypica TaxID=1290095 RepID=A0ABV9YIL4_9PSEU
MTAPGAPSDSERLPGPGRMVAFVDASVAIALTLLVLPLTELVPERGASEKPALEVVTGNLPVFGSFLLSFVVIARFWVVHHRLFGHVGRLTPRLVWVNLFWVLTIVVLPFLTQFVASYGPDPVIVRSYIGVLALCSGALTAMALTMYRLGIADGDGSGPPDDFVDGVVAATVDMALAFLLVLIVPAVNYWALLLLVIDPLTVRAVSRLRRGPSRRSPARG